MIPLARATISTRLALYTTTGAHKVAAWLATRPINPIIPRLYASSGPGRLSRPRRRPGQNATQ